MVYVKMVNFKGVLIQYVVASPSIFQSLIMT